MIIITSGAYISPEFQVELGRLPPALLPLGNKRLCEHQVEALRSSFHDEDIFISLTDAYQLRTSDSILLKRLGVNVVEVPDGLSLGYSLLYVINTIGRYDEVVRVLHGDTFIPSVPVGEDIVGLGLAQDEYPWEIELTSTNSEHVWSGYFSFGDVKLLARSLSAFRGNFVEAVRRYLTVRRVEFPVALDWLDMGHINTYFRSRATITTQRSFNQLRISQGVVRKSSAQVDKIVAEANWYSLLPAAIKRFAPQLIQSGSDEGQAFYELEYLPYLPLNELYVHGNLPLPFWRKIFALADTVLSDFGKVCSLSEDERTKVRDDFRDLAVSKTMQRLSQFAAATGRNLNLPTQLNGHALPSLFDITIACQESVLNLPDRIGVSHGDFCFSNILYDSRMNALKVVDPRGINAKGEQTIYGDLKYDVAKFVHSLVGLYDHIVAGLYTLDEPKPFHFEFEIHVDGAIANIQESFDSASLLGLSAHEVLPLVILLFVSMLPLHSDKPARQQAFIANALRLFILWKGL